MSTVTVTPQQAQHVAALLEQARQAHQRAEEALTLLTLGHPLPEGATIANVNTDTGVLTFHVEPAVSPTEGA